MDYQYITTNTERQPGSRHTLTFSASCSNRRSWKHWSSWSLRTCQAWWRCCRVECSLSSSWVIRGTRPWVSTLQTPPLLLLLPPLPPLLPLRLEKDSLLWMRWSNLEINVCVNIAVTKFIICFLFLQLRFHILPCPIHIGWGICDICDNILTCFLPNWSYYCIFLSTMAFYWIQVREHASTSSALHQHFTGNKNNLISQCWWLSSLHIFSNDALRYHHSASSVLCYQGSSLKAMLRDPTDRKKKKKKKKKKVSSNQRKDFSYSLIIPS